MNLVDILSKYRFPPQAQEAFLHNGITSLYPPQAAAIEKGVLNGRNILMSVPTAAGKTLIAELCMLKSILDHQGRCLYIVPLKALANEKYQDFKKKFSHLGVRVGVSTGDLDRRNKALNRYDILIATAEKVDSLLRSRAKWLIDGLDVVVIDEIHFLNDGSRGPTLEILTTRIKQLNPDVQMLALSATVSNAAAVAAWLKADLVQSSWRPIPLREGVYFNEAIQFVQRGFRLIHQDFPDDLSKLVADTLCGRGQVLVFVNSRRSAQAASRQLTGCVGPRLDPDEKKHLAAIAKKVAGPSSDTTKVCRKLAEVLEHGVAFHHAGLKPKQRELIETHFKKNLIKVICSTPTLAAGVNLPARRAIIRDCKRFESGLGSAYIPVSEYKQCAGRAGRPQYDEYGEALLIAKTLSESKVLMDRYIRADPEPVISKLGEESALRIHVLASIAGGYVHDINDMFDFISHTFLSHQRQQARLIEMIGEIFTFLHQNGFIDKSGFRYLPTPFGQCTSRLYIDPLTALTLREGFNKLTPQSSATPGGLLQLMCCCPDSPRLNVSKKDWDWLEAFAAQYEGDFILDKDDILGQGDYRAYLGILKTMAMLMDWMEEEKEETICEACGIGPGDIYRLTESVGWLLHAGIVFAELFRRPPLSLTLAQLRNRIRYGIKAELLSLVQLKGIGRIRARILFKKGYRRLPDLQRSSVEDLAAIKQIGKALASDIHKQLPKLSQPTSRPARKS